MSQEGSIEKKLKPWDWFCRQALPESFGQLSALQRSLAFPSTGGYFSEMASLTKDLKN